MGPDLYDYVKERLETSIPMKAVATPVARHDISRDPRVLHFVLPCTGAVQGQSGGDNSHASGGSDTFFERDALLVTVRDSILQHASTWQEESLFAYDTPRAGRRDPNHGTVHRL